MVQGGLVPQNPEPLVHLCSLAEWDQARSGGELRPDSLDQVGFVHLSAQHQVHLPANRLFTGRVDLVLLYLDPDRLGAPVHWEPGVACDPAAMLFPHLYGPLPAAAVIDVRPYGPGPDGRFEPLIHRTSE